MTVENAIIKKSPAKSLLKVLKPIDTLLISLSNI
ncbi:MAG: hypothetical protein CFH41_00695 [Alphaproteobacteria bacterium MarineAlpha11_Bin1]|nr:MAG: hypothetical protein CFH41_00695 [Alphaproteobacteria bacterium MarineAlpha11_Bin1]